MRKVMLVFSVMLLFFMAPSYSHATASNLSVPQLSSNEDTYTFNVEGEEYTLTLVTENDVQTIYVESKDGIETVSYDNEKDELRFNGELADKELLGELRNAADELSEDLGLSESLSEKDSISTLSGGYNWKHVKSYKNSFHIGVATVVLVSGVVLLLPTGTGALAGALLTMKLIGIVASAVVAASGTNESKTYYYTFNTYYSPKNGYWNNKFELSVYKNSARTQLVERVSHITPYGKKYD
ncbi:MULTISPECIES: hypothetical protein [unclassified Sporosarcina]|uniref:hypothetical protein n=1 Tax=unclassified Sporosarcina TaxID=2647733 RepID=UPI00203B3BD5|nr:MULTISPECIES: hypothetical protein [unclassified Sporosarcina]GKV67461.1 hypothetical protein NCCP2331_36140 [Sporosarcina sp. NCCP-2331]GLB57827.1 hypothetical protein NCCP2378_36210 [Sporosarcina sp. NCCP-2378]